MGKKFTGGIAGMAMLTALAGAPAAHAQLALDHDATTVAEQTGNGNGIAEPGETLGVTESIMSVEFTTLTGVMGHLSSSAADVTVAPADAAWPNLDFATTGTNVTPFGVALGTAFPCGARVPFDLGITANEGTGSVSFSIPTGAPGTLVGHDATAVPAAIPDTGSLDTPVSVSSSARVKGLRVRVNITHPYDGDLTLTLIAPDGRSVVLASHRGGAGQDFTNTVFDDSAATSIASGSAPFTGSFRPEQSFSTLDGAVLGGTWTLRVSDGTPGSAGSLGSFGLDAAPAVCQSASAPPPPPPPPPAPQPVPPGYDHRSEHAKEHWPAPSGFVEHADQHGGGKNRGRKH